MDDKLDLSIIQMGVHIKVPTFDTNITKHRIRDNDQCFELIQSYIFHLNESIQPKLSKHLSKPLGNSLKKVKVLEY